MNAVLISALFLNVTVVAALPGGISDVSIAEWQPREALLTSLKLTEGLSVRSRRKTPATMPSIGEQGRSALRP